MGVKKTLTEIGDENGVTFRTVKKRLNEAGVEPIGREGRAIFYDSAEANRAIWTAGKTDEELSLEAERAKLTVENRRKAERENNIAEGKVVPIERLSEILSRATRQISSKLDAIPIQLKKKNVNLTAADIDFVRAEIAKCRNIAAQAVIDAKPTK
jgi:phage terminase Nu1 subunit (DNA packaging protein)